MDGESFDLCLGRLRAVHRALVTRRNEIDTAWHNGVVDGTDALFSQLITPPALAL